MRRENHQCSTDPCRSHPRGCIGKSPWGRFFPCKQVCNDSFRPQQICCGPFFCLDLGDSWKGLEIKSSLESLYLSTYLYVNQSPHRHFYSYSHFPSFASQRQQQPLKNAHFNETKDWFVSFFLQVFTFPIPLTLPNSSLLGRLERVNGARYWVSHASTPSAVKLG